MAIQSSLRIRLTFEDESILTQTQQSNGMNNSWILIEPNQHSKISDICNHLLHKFNLHSSCPNGILLFMEGFVLPPSESTRLLKDKDIICVKRKVLALAEATDGENACNLLEEGEVDRNDPPADIGMLLLANEEFDKETGGYKSELKDVKEEMLEDEPSPKEKASKKRKASTIILSSKTKKHRLVVMDGVEDEVAIGDDNINNDESIPKKKITKKIIKKRVKKSGESETNMEKVKSPSKVNEDEVAVGDDNISNEESVPKKKIIKKITQKKAKNGESEANTKKVKSPTKVKRLKKDEDKIKADNDNNDESIPKKTISKKKVKPNAETNKLNAETSDKNIEDDVEGVKPTSTAPDGAKKVPSRSARRKKAKRQWKREQAKILQNPDPNLKPEVAENKEAPNGQSEELSSEDEVPAEIVHKHEIKQEERNCNGNGDTKLVPCVVRPGHIRFEPLDKDEDAKQIEVPDVAFQWNGITSKKKGQKWGLENLSTSRRDDFQKETEEPSTMLTADAQVTMVDAIDFDQLPLCTSPKEGDVIAYRVLELTSSWTPEMSSFRVGKISHYDGDDIVLMPVPEYPIALDKTDEDGPNVFYYGEDGSLEIKYAGLSDVRIVKQSKSDAIKAVSSGVNQSPKGDDDKNAAIVKMSSSNDNKENVSKDPSPVVANRELNTWDELNEALKAKKSELMEIDEEMKKDSGKNKWSYRALRGSALGPTMAMLRSTNNI